MNHSGGSSTDGEECGEDQEGSSSSSEHNVVNVLTSFREQWQRELEISPKKTTSKELTSSKTQDIAASDTLTIEAKAKKLFLKGVEHEQNGKLYEAIQFYKHAVQLVPDIEFRLYESTSKAKSCEKYGPEEHLEELESNRHNTNENGEIQSEEDDEESNLLLKLSKIVNHNLCVCFPKSEQSTTHISILPMEIILHILRWVVSIELDVRSLEVFSRVCRGFYVCARDPEIWRLACARVWGINCGTYGPKYQSWRDMYLQRPRLRYNGCYISKTTYIRHGENSFQDQFYRPWHLVKYFRYLRFFPEGRVLMLTSTDEPQNCVNHLKQRLPRNTSVLIGHYRLHDNRVTLVLKKQEIKRKKDPHHDSGEETFHVEFEIQNLHRRVNSQLMWITYKILTKYRCKNEVNTCFNLCNKFPPLKFSRVKNYTQESEAPLQ